jgi:hypothetical protein
MGLALLHNLIHHLVLQSLHELLLPLLLSPPSAPSAAAATGYGVNSTHELVIVGIIAFVKLSSQHLLGFVVKVLSTTRIC